jgi:Tryptophan synthase alpha chain
MHRRAFCFLLLFIIFASLSLSLSSFICLLSLSDPIADGPTIQTSTHQALLNGTTFKTCLDSVREARAHGLKAPVIFMGYYNPLLAYGEENAVRDARDAGANGFIVVDLPPEERYGCCRTVLCRHSIALLRFDFISPFTYPHTHTLVHVLRIRASALAYPCTHSSHTHTHSCTETHTLTLSLSLSLSSATFYAHCVHYGMSIVPLIAPTTTDARMDMLCKVGRSSCRHVYPEFDLLLCVTCCVHTLTTTPSLPLSAHSELPRLCTVSR